MTEAHPKNGIAYANIARLGLTLPAARPPVANYRKAIIHQDLLYLSGHGPVDASGGLQRGKVGDDVTVEAAYAHARLTGLNLLTTMEDVLGSLNRIVGLVKLLGMVNATPDFDSHPRVIDGCSDLMIEVFGPEIGGHARSAIGVGSLPGRITVEIELIARIA